VEQWLAETVLVPVAAEIDKINQTLAKGSTPTVQIGAASTSDLRRESKRRAPQVPTLHLVLPYLELTPKQAYLVQRIRGKSGLHSVPPHGMFCLCIQSCRVEAV
jgi:hypothetical protein